MGLFPQMMIISPPPPILFVYTDLRIVGHRIDCSYWRFRVCIFIFFESPVFLGVIC